MRRKRSKRGFKGSRKDYKRYKREIWEWYHEIKNNSSCYKCGEDHPSCLEFHHLERDDKHGNISSMIHNCRPMKELREELTKCIVICANCHRKLHWVEDHETEVE